MPKKSGALVRRAAAPAIRRNLTPARATRARPTNPGSIKAVALPARWTTPTPKIPATAMVEHAERLSPGDRHHKPGDLWLHQQRLKGLQRLGRDLQGLEMIFDRVMTGCSEFLPGFFERFNAVNLRADVTTFINALRVLSAEELARAAVADVERRQEQHAGYQRAMKDTEDRRAGMAEADRAALDEIEARTLAAFTRGKKLRQYASGDYQTALGRQGIVGSMSRRGDCWDNAVAESFFATLKVELVHDARWSTRAAARGAVFEYIEIFYNQQRRHSSLGFLSPLAFERQWHQQHRAA